MGAYRGSSAEDRKSTYILDLTGVSFEVVPDELSDEDLNATIESLVSLELRVACFANALEYVLQQREAEDARVRVRDL